MSDPKPLVVQLEPGKHAICTCGQTQNGPYCDGSHGGTELRPEIVEVQDVAMNLAWCTCRISGKLPRCDGSHRQMWDNPEKPPRKPDQD
ncbi:MAG: CDGSH iron-sulfur domain-containing protein [Planctomycetota bacterium]|nr:CDGSH iron-sulfur domain-containing protein [Planctomycetota bacterium]